MSEPQPRGPLDPYDYVSPPMERVGTLACIDPAELARLRHNSERWEWVEKQSLTDCAGWSISPIFDYPGQTIADSVDAAIAAEKGAGNA